MSSTLEERCAGRSRSTGLSGESDALESTELAIEGGDPPALSPLSPSALSSASPSLSLNDVS